MNEGTKVIGLTLAAIVTVIVGLPFMLYVLTGFGDGTALLGFVAFYVLLHYIMEPYRPPWEASLFGTRGSEAIRRRRWLNPERHC
ncbi:MAG: hypothetical protein KGL39_38155 [Patescibacteria group bacterium]|nr:hypothetical protein [Patescibacteria group bacterium]